MRLSTLHVSLKATAIASIAVLAFIAFSGLGAKTASAAEPPALFGVAHLGNQSTAVSTVYYKWGNSSWRKTVINKGAKMAFAYRYDGKSKGSPTLYIRIDVDTDGVKYVEHTLTRSQSPDDNAGQYGHHFVIRQVTGTDTRYIQAVTQGARVNITDSNSSRP